MISSKYLALLYMGFLALATIILKPFFFLNRKEIWFFMDRTFGIDNSYFLYKHVKKNDSNIKSIYFCDNKKDAEFKGLLNDKNVVYKFSLRHFWYFVHASKLIFSFDTDPFYFYKEGLLFKKILKPKAKMIFLQHGVIHSMLEPYSKKYTEFDMFVCSAKREMEQIDNKTMDYHKELKLTGLARFDELKTSSNKTIMFMPTWDIKLFGKTREEIIKSEYYKRINDFLTSKKLYTTLEKYNYKLVFVPHYMFAKYSLFKTLNDRIKVAYSKGKEFIFPIKNKASLLITNYSSVYFDFAYMKKPTIYYQWADYNFKEDFDYKKEAFGKVVNTQDSLLRELDVALKNKCKIEKKYSKRAEAFFFNIDKNNCKRTHNAILGVK